MTRGLVAFVALLLVAGTAHAQFNPYKGNRAVPRLEGSDLTAMEAAGQKLLGPTARATGASEAWRNDATGAFGKVIYVGPTSRKADGRDLSLPQLATGRRPRPTRRPGPPA